MRRAAHASDGRKGEDMILSRRLRVPGLFSGKRALLSALALALSLGAPFALAQDGEFSIDWEVLDRFRLLNDPDDLAFLHSRIGKLVSEEGTRIPVQPLRGHQGRHEDALRPLATKWDSSKSRYAPGFADAKSWRLRLSVAPQPPSGAECAWTVDGSTWRAAPCTDFRPETALEKGSSVAVSVADRHGQPLGAAAWRVSIKDHLIVVLGDSFASGEGYPDVTRREGVVPDLENGPRLESMPAQWWDQRCHRSLFSGPAMAAIRFSHSRPKDSVTFMSYACSGADIGGSTNDGDGGVLSAFEGRETAAQMETILEKWPHWGFQPPADPLPLPPQLDAAASDLCAPERRQPSGECEAGVRQPDVVVLSVGGNDIGFGRIITKMLTSSCREQCVDAIVAERVRALPARYDELARKIGQRLAPRRVLLMEYPNPTRGEGGAYCDDRHFRRGTSPVGRWPILEILAIGEAEYRLAFERAYQPLIDAGNEAVRRNRSANWVRLPRLAASSNEKGVCARKSWITTTAAAQRRQFSLPRVTGISGDEVGGLPTGALHPNFYGYFNYAVALEDYFRRRLGE